MVYDDRGCQVERVPPVDANRQEAAWRTAVQAALFPVAVLGFAAMVAFYFVRGLIWVLLMSDFMDRIGVAVALRVRPETAHNMAIRFLKIIQLFSKPPKPR